MVRVLADLYDSRDHSSNEKVLLCSNARKVIGDDFFIISTSTSAGRSLSESTCELHIAKNINCFMSAEERVRTLCREENSCESVRMR